MLYHRAKSAEVLYHRGAGAAATSMQYYRRSGQVYLLRFFTHVSRAHCSLRRVITGQKNLCTRFVFTLPTLVKP